jgi:hypothetical protein
MATIVREIKAWLKENRLTSDPSDYTATVDSAGSVTMDDIIEELKQDGMELNPATVKDVITRYNNKCIDLVLLGYSVNTGLVHMRACIRGVFHNNVWDAKIHSIYVTISQSKMLRDAIAQVIVKILGVHPEPIAIYTLTDLFTGSTDGTVTRRFNAEIKGTYIEITGDDPECGIYLFNEGRQTDYKLPNEYIVLNEPSRILILIPEDLEPETYQLRIVTQYMKSNKKLKQPRSVVYSLPVIVQ